MSAHTKGPWERLPIQGECKISHADFLLMRAAPELLEALNGFLSASNNGANLERYYDDEIDALWESASAAIRKATGEESA